MFVNSRLVPFADSPFDIVTLFFVAFLLLLSLFSLCFIFFFCFKSRFSQHLQHFNSLWTVRFLLVLFVTLWTVDELIRLPFLRWRYLFPFLPRLTVPQQANLCKIHVLLSLGFFEPGFLVTLLFLLNVSIKKTTPRCSLALAFVFSSCLPILMLQLFFILFSQFDFQMPEFFHRSSVVVRDPIGDEMVLCAYPLLSSMVFGAFGVVYSFSFVISCWKVLSLVINKGLRIRIYGLAFAVLTMLPAKILFLGLSIFWTPEKEAFCASDLVVFLSTVMCAAVGEGVLVIRPIIDSLAVEGDRCHLSFPCQRPVSQPENSSATSGEDSGRRNPRAASRGEEEDEEC